MAPGDSLCRPRQNESSHDKHPLSRDIRICQVRGIIDLAARYPFEAKYRMVIIDPADRLAREAAHTSLKTLEEPPGHTVFALITAAPEAIIETIISRCRRINVGAVARGEVDLDAFSIGVAAHKYQALGPLFDQAVLARRAHFDRMKISSLRNVIVVVARARGPAFRGTFQMSRAAEAILSRRDIDALFRSFGLIAAGKEALGAARLRLRPEVELARLADGSAVLHASPSCPLQIEGFGAETMKLIDSLRAGKPVTDTIRKLTSHPSTHVHRPSLLLATEQLLRAGVLEVAG